MGKGPDWVQWPEGTPSPTPDDLELSRKEIYQAVTLFHDHVKYVIYILTSILAAPLLIMRLIPAPQTYTGFYLIGGSILLALLPPFTGVVSTQIIKRYYQVYVAALVHAVIVHVALGRENTHPWVGRTLSQARDWSDSVKIVP